MKSLATEWYPVWFILIRVSQKLGVNELLNSLSLSLSR